jgi:hypothetical protein
MKRFWLVLVLALLMSPGASAQDEEFTGDSTIGFLGGEGLRWLDLPDEPDGEVRIVAVGGSLVDGSWAAVIYNGLEDKTITSATVTPDETTGLGPSDNLVPGLIVPGQIGLVIPDFPDASESASTLSDPSFDAELDYDTTDNDEISDLIEEGHFDDELIAPAPVPITSAQTIPDSDEGPVVLVSFENGAEERITPATVTAVCFDAAGQIVQAGQQDTSDFYSFIAPMGSSLADIPYDPGTGCETVIAAATSDYEVVD